MIKTKSIRDPADATDGRRILVMGLWPRGCSKEQLKLAAPNGWRRNLAPSRELRQDWYGKKIQWSQYVTRYVKEMESQRTAIAELAELAKTEPITLLCIEDEDSPHCHRHLLKNLIEQAMQDQ